MSKYPGFRTHPQAPSHYVYCDGSYMNHGCEKSGVGFVITNFQGVILHEGSLKIGNANSSTLAEVRAVSLALKAIEAPSSIVLYNDEENLCETIARKRFAERIRCSATRPFLRDAYIELQRAVSYHFNVIAQRKNDSDDLMLRAHQLAQAGTDNAIMLIYAEPDTNINGMQAPFI